jgi:hypothetical protein
MFILLDPLPSLIGLIWRWMLEKAFVVKFGRESKDRYITSRSS